MRTSPREARTCARQSVTKKESEVRSSKSGVRAGSRYNAGGSAADYIDPQLERAVEEAMRLLKLKPVDRLMKEPPPPTWGKRKVTMSDR